MSMHTFLICIPIITILFISYCRVALTVDVKLKYKTTKYKDGKIGEMLIGVDEVNETVEMIKRKYPELVNMVTSIELVERPDNGKDNGLTAAIVDRNKRSWKGDKAKIRIFPYFTTDGEIYFMESQYGDPNLPKMYWTKKRAKMNCKFSLCHEFGHLKLWHDGINISGPEVEKKCDRFAQSILGYAPSQNVAVPFPNLIEDKEE